MTNTHPALRSPSLALIIGASILVSACGGGSSTPAAAPAVVNPPANSTVTSTSTIAPPVSATSGFVGSCPSLVGGSSTPLGYEIGFCNTFFASGASLIAEGTFQNLGVSTVETSANQYTLNLPTSISSAGPITLVLGGANVPQTGATTPATIGNLSGGYQLDRFITTAAPADDRTSVVDFGGALSPRAQRHATFGLWGRSKLLNENFYGGFFGAAASKFPTPALFSNGATNTVSFTGSAVSWYLYSSNSAVPAGVSSRIGLSATADMQVNFSSNNLTGTIKDFFAPSAVTAANPTGAPTNLGLTPITFTATLVKADGSFSGTITGGGSGIVKGSLFGPNAEQAAGQFVLTASGNRMFSGSFGVKQ